MVNDQTLNTLRRFSFTLNWTKDRESYRVWRTDWIGDTFEVLTEREFYTFRTEMGSAINFVEINLDDVM